ncbi:hypothetical protein BDR04DRAFT_1228254 [Suillus decipiens]|nr:hypothetical protein BDR04DRAFT_1228254 [Suillus decipiens]
MPSKTNTLKATTISRIPRYPLRPTRERQATIGRSNDTQSKEATPLRTNSESALSSSVSAPGDVPPRVASPATSVGKLARSYSDVLMARIPPMPGALGETPIRPRDDTAEDDPSGGTTAEPVGLNDIIVHDSRDIAKNKNRPTFEIPKDCGNSQGDTSEDAGDDQHGPWTTVSRKRHGSAERVRYQGMTHPSLTPEQENLVRRAENLLTESERGRIRAREHLPSMRTAESSGSGIRPMMGPPQDKGKAPDPRNWGDVDLDDEDLDIDTQREAL